MHTATHDIWETIRSTLSGIYSLPHNQVWLKARSKTVENVVQEKLDEIRSGINGTPAQETFHGPKTFLRVVGTSNRVYGGEWWFDAALLQSLEQNFARIYFAEQELHAALTAMLREVLAVATEWNAMDEVWVLSLPGGQTLTGFSGFGNPQKLFANKPLSATGNRLLVGRARQLYFPVKNPLWITKLRQLG